MLNLLFGIVSYLTTMHELNCVANTKTLPTVLPFFDASFRIGTYLRYSALCRRAGALSYYSNLRLPARGVFQAERYAKVWVRLQQGTSPTLGT